MLLISSQASEDRLELAVGFYSLTQSRAVLQMENLVLRQQSAGPSRDFSASGNYTWPTSASGWPRLSRSFELNGFPVRIRLRATEHPASSSLSSFSFESCTPFNPLRSDGPSQCPGGPDATAEINFWARYSSITGIRLPDPSSCLR